MYPFYYICDVLLKGDQTCSGFQDVGLKIELQRSRSTQVLNKIQEDTHYQHDIRTSKTVNQESIKNLSQELMRLKRLT